MQALESGKSWWHQFAPAAALLALAAAASYVNGLGGTLVFDDVANITNNPNIFGLWPANRFFQGHRPLVDLSLALNYALGGVQPWGYRLVNLAIHILAGWTLLDLLRRLLTRPSWSARVRSAGPGLALAISLLWVVHPLNTQAVNYIIQRAESMAALFYLLTINAMVRSVQAKEQEPAQNGRAWLWMVLAMLACWLGMGAKPTLATVPLAALAMDWTLLGRSWRVILLQRWALYLGLFSSWLALVGLLGMGAQVTGQGVSDATAGFTLQSVTPFQYLQTQASVLVHYLRLSVWPDVLVIDYHWPVVKSLREALLPGTLILALLGWTIWGLWRQSWLGLAGSWFFLVLAPTSSFMPIADVAAEHRMYPALPAVIGVMVAGGWTLMRKWVERTGLSDRALQTFATGALVLATMTLSWRTVTRNRDYADEYTLWRSTARAVPGNPRAHLNLGLQLLAQGKIDQAQECFNRTLQLNPQHAGAISNLGVIAQQRGDVILAINLQRRAVELQPSLASARTNLGQLLLKTGQVEEGLSQLELAVGWQPQNSTLRMNYVAGLALAGRIDQAVAQLDELLRRDPNDAEAHALAGALWIKRGNPGKAIPHLAQAARMQPSNPQAMANLGQALLQVKQYRQAATVLEEALRLQPGQAVWHLSAAVAAEQSGQRDGAASHYQQVLRLSADPALMQEARAGLSRLSNSP